MELTTEECATLRAFYERTRWHDDRGPAGEGWQSDELVSLVSATGSILDRLEREAMLARITREHRPSLEKLSR